MQDSDDNKNISIMLALYFCALVGIGTAFGVFVAACLVVKWVFF
jgi:hypothetical protein